MKLECRKNWDAHVGLQYYFGGLRLTALCSQTDGRRENGSDWSRNLPHAAKPLLPAAVQQTDSDGREAKVIL